MNDVNQSAVEKDIYGGVSTCQARDLVRCRYYYRREGHTISRGLEAKKQNDLSVVLLGYLQIGHFPPSPL